MGLHIICAKRLRVSSFFPISPALFLFRRLFFQGLPASSPSRKVGSLLHVCLPVHWFYSHECT
ncbi:predicted protein [Plenodomus lingam JN3]|uniref:Predicted protein n=1 Tax=Leptosphaeria maculans (strain JN3 / isolate v23.1.3 / race Av1-4-5-6-7-8) TaxID=985895 RepID=E4ZQK5_LEPMJ|nr:predicted protein [Plenodomus lingam JN3]CBX94010.1 predicted protein [Plenodomus lingam JN3]